MAFGICRCCARNARRVSLTAPLWCSSRTWARGHCARHLSASGSGRGTEVWRPGSCNIDLLVNNPCHCFLISRHCKWPVPVKVHISICATYNLPPSLTLTGWVGRGHRSGKLTLLINNDVSQRCKQRNHAMRCRTLSSIKEVNVHESRP